MKDDKQLDLNVHAYKTVRYLLTQVFIVLCLGILLLFRLR